MLSLEIWLNVVLGGWSLWSSFLGQGNRGLDSSKQGLRVFRVQEESAWLTGQLRNDQDGRPHVLVLVLVRDEVQGGGSEPVVVNGDFHDALPLMSFGPLVQFLHETVSTQFETTLPVKKRNILEDDEPVG